MNNFLYRQQKFMYIAVLHCSSLALEVHIWLMRISTGEHEHEGSHCPD